MSVSDKNFADWEGSAFGFGYGSGEPHILPAIKRMMDLTPADKSYDYAVYEAELGPLATWFLINALCRAGFFEYGSSPRFAWLTAKGKAFKQYVDGKTADELIEVCERSEDDVVCYPDACNCGPEGYEAGRKCDNPLWP